MLFSSPLATTKNDNGKVIPRRVGTAHKSHNVGVRSSPIAWARSNVIFSPHPTRPSVHGQIISGTPNTPSTHHFELPLPDPVNASPALFSPPTCIIISDKDSHLFAFFPPSYFSMPHATGIKLGGGVSCVWERTNEITSWHLLEFWPSERGNDVIAGQWLDNNRKASALHLGKFASPICCSTPIAFAVDFREDRRLIRKTQLGSLAS